MGIDDEQLRMQWRDAIARIAAQIDSLRSRIDSESRLLHGKLSAEIALLQADLRDLETEMFTAGPDMYARQIARQIEELRAKGDAAYDLLQASVATESDTIDAEIRRMEAIAATTSGDARAKIMVRVERLKAERDAQQQSQRASEQTGHSGDAWP